MPADWFDDGLDAERMVAELGAGGLVAGRELPAEAPALALSLQGDDGPEYWIGLPNFYVITRYNHSALYAMAVYQLSERLREGAGA